MVITNIVAAILVLEAGSFKEPKEGMEAVKEVVQNRAKIQHKTPEQIVIVPKQFSCLNGKTQKQAIKLANKWPDSVKERAQYLATHTVTNNYVMGATLYCTTNCHPYWETTPIKVIGGHKFFKE